jgi:hypothetical protein
MVGWPSLRLAYCKIKLSCAFAVDPVAQLHLLDEMAVILYVLTHALWLLLHVSSG